MNLSMVYIWLGKQTAAWSLKSNPSASPPSLYCSCTRGLHPLVRLAKKETVTSIPSFKAMLHKTYLWPSLCLFFAPSLCQSLTLPRKCPISNLFFIKKDLFFFFLFWLLSCIYMFIGDNLENNIQEHICFQSFFPKPVLNTRRHTKYIILYSVFFIL